MSTSECSSGCESGWTTYLDHSSVSAYQYDKSYWRSMGLNVDQQTEDLSMVSDASSGPRYVYDEDNSSAYFSASASGLVFEQQQGTKKQKNKIKGMKNEDAYLDDTASSPVFKNKLSHSINQGSMVQESNQDYSATQHKGKSALKKGFGFLKSSVSGKAASQKSGGLQGRKWQ
ncbi:Peripheral-type benzodiazepine receptor-associated 1 [Heracleum sosnowskyi]|uniref:Peripheral-type benzodiazepine receptor-associated 1 n=1 Tax=Heracleum sosnowskyi TaxID=360622 RepID=A0AAD8HGV6_9APIA|nr:Peripheral-type benzodiazepine receptor-associated 1 [Heracleum sosnowskyi]